MRTLRRPRRARGHGWSAAAVLALLAAPLALLTPTTASADAADVTVVYSEGARWDTGYSGQFTIDNGSSAR